MPPATTGDKIKRFFITGLAGLLPAFLTLFIVIWFFGFVDSFVGEPLGRLVMGFLARTPEQQALYDRSFLVSLLRPLVSFFLAFGFVFLVGFLLASYVGKRILSHVESVVANLPVVRKIYPYAKQIVDFFMAKKSMDYGAPVAFEYPRKGIYTIGFVTSGGLKCLNEMAGETVVTVFVPSSPTPVTGWTVFVPLRDLVFLPLTTEDVAKLLISGGVLVPGGQETGFTREAIEKLAKKDFR